MKTFSEVYKSTTFKAGAAIIGSYLLYILADFMFPLFLAVGLSFLLAPIARQFEKLTVGKGKIHISRGVAIFLSFVVFAAFVSIVVAVIAPPLLEQMNELLKNLPEYAKQAHISDWQAMAKNGNYPTLPSSLQNIADSLIGWLMGMVGIMVRGLISSSMDIVTGIVSLVVVPFLSFYFLKDWQELCDMFVDLFRVQDREKVKQVLLHIGTTLAAYVQGLGKLCLISGLAILAGTLLLGMKYSLVFGFIAILAETIPIFGPVASAAAAIFTAYNSSMSMAVNIAVFYAVYYMIDANILMPRIMGKSIDLPAVILLVALMIGGKLFGIVGMLFAVPVAAVYRVLYKELWHYGD